MSRQHRPLDWGARRCAFVTSGNRPRREDTGLRRATHRIVAVNPERCLVGHRADRTMQWGTRAPVGLVSQRTFPTRAKHNCASQREISFLLTLSFIKVLGGHKIPRPFTHGRTMLPSTVANVSFSRRRPPASLLRFRDCPRETDRRSYKSLKLLYRVLAFRYTLRTRTQRTYQVRHGDTPLGVPAGQVPSRSRRPGPPLHACGRSALMSKAPQVDREAPDPNPGPTPARPVERIARIPLRRRLGPKNLQQIRSIGI
jgi:hypothetical protein